MVHSRDHEEVSMAHELMSPKNQLKSFQMMMVGKESPKKLSDQPETFS